MSDVVSSITAFESAKTAALTAAKQYANALSVVVVCRDKDYTLCGNGLKEMLKEQGFFVNAISLSDDEACDAATLKPLFEFSLDTGLIVAVGDADVINLARYFGGLNGIRLIAIPLSADFHTVYSQKAIIYTNNFPISYACELPIKVVLDKEYFAFAKKYMMADAFSEVAAKIIAAYECLVLGKRELAGKLLSAIRLLTKINEFPKRRLGIIMSAELLLARVCEAEPICGAESAIGYILAKFKRLPRGECEMAAVRPLLNLYEAFYKIEMIHSPTSPNYAYRVEQLSEMLHIPEYILLEGLSPRELATIEREKEEYLQDKENMLTALYDFRKLFFEVERAYSLVYNGKQKRAEISLRELKRAFAIAPVLKRDGIFGLLSDGGVIDCFD